MALYKSLAEPDQGLAAFSEAIRLNPRAVESATKACDLTDWKNRTCLATLAAAYAECDDFDKSVEWQKRADDGDPQPITPVARDSPLELFLQNKPLRLKLSE